MKVQRMLSASSGKIELLLGRYCMSIPAPSKSTSFKNFCETNFDAQKWPVTLFQWSKSDLENSVACKSTMLKGAVC